MKPLTWVDWLLVVLIVIALGIGAHGLYEMWGMR